MRIFPSELSYLMSPGSEDNPGVTPGSLSAARRSASHPIRASDKSMIKKMPKMVFINRPYRREASRAYRAMQHAFMPRALESSVRARRQSFYQPMGHEYQALPCF